MRGHYGWQRRCVRACTCLLALLEGSNGAWASAVVVMAAWLPVHLPAATELPFGLVLGQSMPGLPICFVQIAWSREVNRIGTFVLIPSAPFPLPYVGNLTPVCLKIWSPPLIRQLIRLHSNHLRNRYLAGRAILISLFRLEWANDCCNVPTYRPPKAGHQTQAC